MSNSATVPESESASIAAPTAEAAARHYRQQGFWRDETVWDLALRLLQRQPDRVSHHFDDEAVALAEAVDQARRLAGALHERGFRAGDVVAFQLPNWRETLAIDLACARLGLIVVPIIPIYRDAELAFMLADCGARAVFVPGGIYRGFDYKAMLERLAPDLPALEMIAGVRDTGAEAESFETLLAHEPLADDAVPAAAPDSVKMMLYTSGTTGRPKAVLHSHNTIACVVREAYSRWDQGEGDVMLMASPVTHITGFGALELPFLIGMHCVFMERWEPAAAIALADAHGVTMSMGATPFLKELLDAARDAGSRLPSLQRFACGGAEVPPELIRRAWSELAQCRAFRVYGSSEAPLVTLGFTGDEEARLAAETDGRIGIYDVVIAGEDGERLEAGADGEICVRGPALFLCYRDPEQTREAFDDEGYFRSGDIGHRGPGDSLVITGRKKDLINRGGEKISAKEVEDVLHQHPSVREVAVVAMPHPRLGETVCACVIPEADARPDLAALTSQCAEAGIARQKHPEAVVCFEDFPRTASGKIRKDLLRGDERVRSAGSGDQA